MGFFHTIVLTNIKMFQGPAAECTGSDQDSQKGKKPQFFLIYTSGFPFIISLIVCQ